MVSYSCSMGRGGIASSVVRVSGSVIRVSSCYCRSVISGPSADSTALRTLSSHLGIAITVGYPLRGLAGL